MTAPKWKVAFLILLVLFVSLLGFSILQGRSGASPGTNSVVLQVQKLNNLVTVRYRVQRVVAMTEQKDPIGEESILLMVEGEVQGGVDLGKVTAADVTTDETGAVTIALPDASVTNAFLDEKNTKVWDRHVTWWTPWVPADPDLEHKARLKALDEVRQAALGMGLLDQARSNAKTAVRDLFGALGIKVNVRLKGLD